MSKRTDWTGPNEAIMLEPRTITLKPGIYILPGPIVFGFSPSGSPWMDAPDGYEHKPPPPPVLPGGPIDIPTLFKVIEDA